MSHQDLQGKRILVTQAGEFMGPMLCQVLSEHGATVLVDHAPLLAPDEAARMIGQHGHIDVLLANLAYPAPNSLVTDVQDSEWRAVFEHLVDPLPRLARAVLPQMKARGQGKILVMGSASALRGMPRSSTYCAARGAQLSWVQAAGIELAPDGIQINMIAQNFVDNPTYFPKQVQEHPKFQARLKRDVPLGRLVSAREDAEFAAYLCSDKADHFVGQAFPVCGGWAVR